MNVDVHKRITSWGARVVTVTGPTGATVEISWRGRVSDEFMERAAEEARRVMLRDAVESHG